MTFPSSPVAIPPAPREPSPRAHRLIFRYQGSQFVMLLVGLIFLGIGLILSTVFCWSLPVDLTIAFTGEKLVGRVVSSEINYNVSINGVHPNEVRFTYTTAGGTFEGSSDMTGPDDKKPAADDAIDLEVSKVRPAWSRVAGGSYGLFGYWGVFTLLFPMLGGALAFFAVRSNRREINAYRFGTPVMATIVFCGPDRSTTLNGRHPFKIDWEYSVGGQVHTGSISSMLHTELAEWAEQKTIPVVYDPADPSSSTLYVP